MDTLVSLGVLGGDAVFAVGAGALPAGHIGMRMDISL